MFKSFAFLLSIFCFFLEAGETSHSHPPHSKDQLLFRIEEGQTGKNSLKSTGHKVKGQRTYHLTVDYKTVNFTGHKKEAMAVNDSLPAPTLYFTEGQTAVVHVTNKMDVETSIHWHGILLPNFQDGVPYLTTPPIKPGNTHTFTFPLKQSGTYWYHSHTGLQEQRGVYGAIVIEPKKKQFPYDHNLTLVLSDWTDENPKQVLKNLKKGSEWYSVKKQTTQSLYKVIKHSALGAQFSMWRERMPGMDISDVYYPAFLINGQKKSYYPRFKSGRKIRLRVINAGASTYFWLSFGKALQLVSSDGIDVQPILKNKILHAIGETYDFLLTLPEGKSVEFRATAQDGSGFATALIGTGKVLKAPTLSKPDLMEQMKSMAASHGVHGHGAMNSPHSNHTVKKENKSMHHQHHINEKEVHKDKKSKTHQHHVMRGTGKNKLKPHQTNADQEESGLQNHQGHVGQTHHKINKPTQHQSHSQEEEKKSNNHQRDPKSPFSVPGYDDLRAVGKTDFSKDFPVRTIHLNLTGNMRRYVWSMNGKTLSESDKIKIRKNEIVRMILQNKTMMHHPMHLHGHFFRVLNKQEDFSPLKHTVDVPPMETVVLEFVPDAKGDWFFHCHVLYHMKGGMARVFRQGDTRDSRLKDFPLSRLWNADRQWYFFGELTLMTNRADLQFEITNTRNRISFFRTMSWVDNRYKAHRNYEMEASYEYFFTDFFRLYGGLKAENPEEGFWGLVSETDWAGKAGIRYLLPYLVELDFSLDHKLRLEVELEYEILILSRLELFADWSWTEYFSRKERRVKKREQEWSLGLNYIMSQYFLLKGSYDSHFGWGGGISWQF